MQEHSSSAWRGRWLPFKLFAISRPLWLAAIALPWLNPFAGGPSALMQPWLIAAALTLLLWVLVAPPVSRTGVCALVVAAASMVALGRAAPPVILAVGGLTVIAVSAAVASCLARRGRVGDVMVTGWIIAALASSAMGIAQYFGLSADLAPWINTTSLGEAFGNLRQRNQFATLTSIGLLALLWRMQHGTGLRWGVAAAALIAAANAASASRTGALQLVLIVGLSAWGARPVHRGVAAVCIAAVVAYGIAAVLFPLALQHSWGVSVPNAFGRLASADGCASRAVLWGNVLHLIGQKPWVGWGWGELDYGHFVTLYPGARFCDILDNAHNLPLHLAVELGVPAALLACFSFIAWLARQRPWRETDATRRLAWGVIVVILLHSLLEYPIWYGPFQMALGFSLGLLVKPRPQPDFRAVGPVGRSVLTTSLLLALACGAWDYLRISQLYTSPEERSAIFSNKALPGIGDSWLFRDQVAFAVLSITPLTRENAAMVNKLALELLHYSPEPRVIDSAIQSAILLDRDDQAAWLLERYRAAFPIDAASAAVAREKPQAGRIRD